MFKNPPKILAHAAATRDGNFVTPDFIIGKDGESLFNRYCPHRRYPINEVGGVLKESIVCNFHGFEWSLTGEPINNNKRLGCGKVSKGKSGLLFKDFTEPDHQWVDDLASETQIEYSHVRTGTSKGSWLWMMEIQADLLHIRKGEDAVHPQLSEVTELDDTELDHGEGWILQTCSTGWWLFIYPFTFIEYSKGCVAVNYTTPNDINNEFGFSWHTQYYFDPSVSQERRDSFELYIEPVFIEDVTAIEKQKGPWFPIVVPVNRLEDHCVHYGKWVRSHLVNN
jgi:phenylpropionate dioxygenase-like ring-hydroxylating dioxygenase large terminal subunit